MGTRKACIPSRWTLDELGKPYRYLSSPEQCASTCKSVRWFTGVFSFVYWGNGCRESLGCGCFCASSTPCRIVDDMYTVATLPERDYYGRSYPIYARECGVYYNTTGGKLLTFTVMQISKINFIVESFEVIELHQSS